MKTPQLKINFSKLGGLGGLPICWVGYLNNIQFVIPIDVAYTRNNAFKFVQLIIYYLSKNILKSNCETQYVEFNIENHNFTILIDKDFRTKEIYVTAYRNSPRYH